MSLKSWLLLALKIKGKVKNFLSQAKRQFDE
jgi:hypothetical protein